ncbi:MAG: hypothetical protein M5U01_21600 [Ardenticatenaceae bacterium]|nr:hypothetical protein [Ardenticatenaceae bacterium]
MTDPSVYDYQGNRRDMQWARDVYGMELRRVEEQPGEHVYRIVEIREAEGPAVQLVTVRNESGARQIGIGVARYWPDAPPLPFEPASEWKPKGVVGYTNESGDVGFGLGRGDYITAPGQGVTAVWVADPAVKSDLADKLGMIAGTNHRRLDFVFQLTVPETTGDDDSGAAAGASLTARVAALESRMNTIEGLLDQDTGALIRRFNTLEDKLRRLRDTLADLD